jgi:ribosomal protein S18 acetylase RimI-like enzyme
MEIKRISLAESSLVIGLFDKYRSFYKQPSDKALAEKYINERLENNESIIFVALENESGTLIPAGFTQLYPKYSSVSAQKNWILNDLYVDAAHRKKGIGEALIKTAMDFAKNDGATYVQLETAVDNYTAQSLYDAIGFKKQIPETGYLVYRIGIL